MFIGFDLREWSQPRVPFCMLLNQNQIAELGTDMYGHFFTTKHETVSMYFQRGFAGNGAFGGSIEPTMYCADDPFAPLRRSFAAPPSEIGHDLKKCDMTRNRYDWGTTEVPSSVRTHRLTPSMTNY